MYKPKSEINTIYLIFSKNRLNLKFRAARSGDNPLGMYR